MKIKPIGFVSVAALLLTWVPGALAHRPFATEDIGTAPPGKVEFEVGHEVAEAGNDDDDYSITGSYTVGTGITPAFSVEMTGQLVYKLHQAGASESGFGDLELLGKYRFAEASDSAPGIAAVGKVVLPTGDSEKGLGSAEADYTLSLVATKGWERWATHAGIGWDFLSASDDQLTGSVAFDYEVGPKWHLLAEWDGATDFDSDTQDEKCGFRIGALWIPREEVIWDFSIRFGTTSEEDDYTFTNGVTLAF